MSSLRPLGCDQLRERFGKLLGVGDGCRVTVEAYVRAKAATRPGAPSPLAVPAAAAQAWSALVWRMLTRSVRLCAALRLRGAYARETSLPVEIAGSGSWAERREPVHGALVDDPHLHVDRVMAG